MSSGLKLAILVLNYNGWRHLDALLATAGFLRSAPHVELIVIDNASCDGSLENMRAKYPWVTIVRNEKNYGWGNGYNVAIRTLERNGGNYSHYMFLNNDVFLTEAWLAGILTFAGQASSQVGEFGCRSVFVNKFVREILFSYPKSFNRLFVDFSPRHPHAHKSKQVDGSAINLRVIHQSLPNRMVMVPETLPNASVNPGRHRLLYAIIAVNFNEKETCRLTFASGTEVVAIQTGELATTVYVKPSAKATRGTAFFDLPAEKSATILRLASDDDEYTSLIQNSGLGMTNTFEGYDLHAYQETSVAQEHQKVRGICGVCKVVTRQAYADVGGYDPNFFMYYEDLDFSMNLQARGYASAILPDVHLLHLHAGSTAAGSFFFDRQVYWSRFYFHYRQAPARRRVLSWLKTQFNAWREESEGIYALARIHSQNLEHFESLGLSHYLFGGKL